MAQLNTVKGHQTGAGVRGRDAEFPSAPAHVSDNAQAVALDINTVRQFYFSNQHPGRIPDRPSTSGGTGTTSDFPVRRNARKRETKDDLYFRPPASHGQETTLYNFPLPRSLPTPSSSPRESTPLPRKSSLLPRPSTLDSIEAEREVEMPQMEIGMAIGSPSHPPATWRQSKFESHAWSQYPDPMEDSMDDSIAPAPVKQKSSRWKMLGGLFGGGKKQNSAQAQAFYQLQPERQQQMPAEPGHVHFGESPESKPRGRGRTNSERKIGRKKPDMKRSNTAPQQFDLEPSRVRPANPQITLDGGPIVDNVIQREPSDGGLMLNVDIPSVEMERYSVMFGSLLPKTPGLHSPLLARRQATLDKLKTVNEELALKEKELEAKSRKLHPRRATSPQPRSPAFSLFPNTPSRQEHRDLSPGHGGRRTPLHRSNTSPAALSPSRPTFAPGPDNQVHATLMGPGPHLPVTYEQPYEGQRTPNKTPSQSQKKEVPKPISKVPISTFNKPNQPTPLFTPDQSHLTLSPNSDVHSPDGDIYDPTPFPMKPQLTEPTWQMIKPHPGTPVAASVSGSTTSYSDHSTSASASSISTSTSSTPHSAPHSASFSHKALPQNPTTASVPAHKPTHTSPPSAHATRSRSATIATTSTTSSIRTRRNPSEVSLASSTFSATPNSTAYNGAEVHDDEHEAHLKSLADVSIARQISVSRQQRQLLIPINRNKSKSSVSSPSGMNTVKAIVGHNQNFPSPLQSLNGNAMGVNVGKIASPLGAVEMATMEERELQRERERKAKEREGSPLSTDVSRVDKKERKERRERREKERERLVEGVKPSTPTLVVVGGENGGNGWNGNVADPGSSAQKMGLAERRRMVKGKEGEVKGGLAVATWRGHEHRKSEKVVVERVSVHSDRS